MAADDDDSVELKFRLADGTDIGPDKYRLVTTVASLKENVISRLSRDKQPECPKTIDDIKLIHAGKILENNSTLSESRLQVGEFPGGILTMHVVVRPPQAHRTKGREQTETRKKSQCFCTIL